MSTFEDRLALRLARLDAAVPGPRSLPSAETLHASSNRRGPFLARRGRLAVLAPAALLAVAAVAMAQGPARPEAPDTALDTALGGVFAQADCVPASAARPAIEARLADLGRSGWTIELRPGAASAACVAAVAFSDERTILLLPAAGEAVSRAMQVLANDLLSQCLDRQQATDYTRGVLDGLGLESTAIRIDPAAHTAPSGSIDEYERHVAAGCYVYSGYQHDAADGAPFVVLWGR